VLSELVARSVNVPAILDAEVFYAFIRQNLPADLPGDLLLGTSEWETIAQLTELAASGIVFLDDALQELAIDNAITQNLVSQKIKVNKTAILNELKNQRSIFVLNRPILIGNGNLQSLLDQSKIEAANYQTVAGVFVKTKGINASFWEEINKHAADIGSDAINDFASTIETGNISKNHIPTLTFLKNKIGQDRIFKTASDVAKLDHQEIVQLINENGKQVPDNIPGGSPDEKVANYAAAMKNRAEFLYPAVSLIATIKRSNTPKITKITEVQNFIDEQKELNFRQQNIDKYLIDKNINLDPKVKEELKVVQRVHKLITNSSAGSALVEEGLHSSLQIYFTGKDRLMSKMTAKGVDPKHVHHVYEASKMQYMEVLARITDFSREIHRDTPAAIIPHVYNKTEIQETLGDIPDLETLFGSLDFCDCEYCRSLLSPSAYLTDMLRFLKEHDSLILQNGETLTVKDILFVRRPDLGNIKLNCDNTNIPLPYIDLVCEILENNIAPQQKNFSFQTTLSQKELRAIPQYIRPEAYSVLASSDFPISSSFNLWQEETRTYLNHLRVPRWELMEVFQDTSDPNNKIPDDVSIAAEYFGISSKEKDLIITQGQTAVDQDKYWGFDTTQTSISVSLFMKKTKLSYNELLELLLVRFVNNPDDVNKIRIERPADSLDLDLQTLTNLNLSKFDLLHRFIRLWRKTGWKMWELDLLVRNSIIGNNSIDGSLLVNLKRFKQLRLKLKLPFETLLAFYGQINREIRIKADSPQTVIQPLYNNLFQNQSITNPVDSFFKAIDNNNDPIDLDNNIILGINAPAPYNGYTPVPTILSAIAIRQKDFELLVPKTDNHLSVDSLSILLRFSYYARSLRLSIDELLLFLDIINNNNPFNNLQATLDAITILDNIRASGLSLYELDYILNFNPDSPVGLRDESILQLLQTLRITLENNRTRIIRLKLSDANRDSILAFNADALPAMTNVQLAAALTPLKAILNSAIDNFTAASFSVDETTFIIQFNTTSSTSAAKAKLADNIKKLQKNLSDLFRQNKDQIKSQAASSFGLTDEQAAIILSNIKVAPGPVPLVERLEDPVLIAKNPDGSYKEINRTNFPGHFNAFLLLHKVSLAVSKMKIPVENLEFFILNFAALDTLNFSALPVSTTPGPNAFIKWQNLLFFHQFASKFPEPEEASIRSILNLAINAAASRSSIIDEISKLTQWNSTDISAIDTGFKIQHSPGNLGYTKPDVYQRMLYCFYQMKLTGVDALTMFSWAIITSVISHDVETALQTRHAVKSKYEQDEWLQKVTPLHDAIREMKRTALVEYHLENSQRNELPEVEVNRKLIPNPLFWEDSNSLFKYFLIDVEMSSCQLTSRTKQALSSVQLFVQRCFLNLENRFVQVV
ncbi:MAG TPA: neuraminidase-like domain-containing protein, partial [Ignavibacteriaceae bacterium]|nr:neuraminidase-like domain-containing protein [Ignavibacteriaceae bacterium]